MRDHGYDLRHYAKHMAEIGPKLVDKLHLYCATTMRIEFGRYLFEISSKEPVTEQPAHRVWRR